MNKAIFLDRDGVINHDPGDYTYSIDEFHILPGVLDFMKDCQEKGYLIVVITNQGGIAKGLYDHSDVTAIHTSLLQQAENAGVEINDIFYSPHHDSISNSLSRKPGSLLVERAIYKYTIDPIRSFFIGDKERDIFAGEAAGVQGILISKNAPLSEIADQIP